MVKKVNEKKIWVLFISYLKCEELEDAAEAIVKRLMKVI